MCGTIVYRGWKQMILAAVLVVAGLTGARAEILDDFDGTSLDTSIWEPLGPKSYEVAGGFITWTTDAGDNWAKGEIVSQDVHFLPEAGETSTVTWVVGPGQITTDTGGRSIRFQMGLVSADQTGDSREHWGNTTGGIWIDIVDILSSDTAQFGADTLAANDTKGSGGDATTVADIFVGPWNWQTETTTFRVEITADTFSFYHNSTLMGTYAWADYDIDTEFANGYTIFAMGQNSDTGRGTLSLDRVEVDNLNAGAGLISSFSITPPQVVGGAPSRLMFEVAPAAIVDIQPDIGAVPHTNGVGAVTIQTMPVDATTSTVYTLTSTVGGDSDTRQAVLTVRPIPQVSLADFDEQFDAADVDTNLWTVLTGGKTVAFTNGLFVINEDGDNWSHGQVASIEAYAVPGPGEFTEITFVLGPAAITTDNGATANSIRYQMGIFSADDPSGYSFEHYQNSTGGAWLDLDGIRSGSPTSVGGLPYYANDTKENGSNATGMPGIEIANWDWQNESRAITLQLTESGFSWSDGGVSLGSLTWAEAGIDFEFLSGYRIVAAGMNYDAGRGSMSYDAVTAVSTTPAFDMTGIALGTGGVDISWELEAGATYTVNRAMGIDGPWNALVTDLPSNTFTDSTMMDGSIFYQVEKTPPPPLLSAGFEPGEDLTGWVEVVETGSAMWQVGVPTVVGPPSAHSGTQVYATILDGDYPLNSTAGLRTPVIDLTGVSSARLSFYQWYDIEDGWDNGFLYLLDEAGNRLLPDPINTTTGQSGEWQIAVVQLPAAAIGQRVRLEFRMESDNAVPFAGWYIDDVLVQ